MGTRASFWVGNPTDLDNREWLGRIAWDGYPDGLPELADVSSEAEFREVVAEYSERDDFAHPEGGWPFPWADNIFLTDHTYAFFDGEVKVACFDKGWASFADAQEGRYPGGLKATPSGKEYDWTQPDSIMIIGLR